MKDLKDICEGILDRNNKQNVGKGFEILFGDKYRIKLQTGLNRVNLRWFNGRVINKITKDIERMHPDTGSYFNHDDMQMKVGKLCMWIEHINLTEWGITDVMDDTEKFTKQLRMELDKLGVFNNDTTNPNYNPYIFVCRTNRSGCELMISINNCSWNYDNRIDVYFERID